MTAATIEQPRAARKVASATAGPEEAKMRQLSQILYDASQTDGEDLDSGYSLRLLRLASEMALDYAAGFDRRPADNRVNAAFDLAALVSASRRVPMDLPLPASMLSKIEEARLLLNDLTEAGDCFDDGQAKPAAPSAPFLNGYTPTQLRDILGHMACSCISATELMLDISVKIGGGDWTPSQCKTALHAASQTVSMVGAMADQSAGGRIMGGPIEWSMGDRDMKGSGHA